MDPKPSDGGGDEEPEDPEVLKKKEIAKDPWEPRLKPITKDEKIKGGLPGWILRSYNCGHKYLDEKS